MERISASRRRAAKRKDAAPLRVASSFQALDAASVGGFLRGWEGGMKPAGEMRNTMAGTNRAPAAGSRIGVNGLSTIRAQRRFHVRRNMEQQPRTAS
jgi:hypothetical protein